jgi:hypothetical protein
MANLKKLGMYLQDPSLSSLADDWQFDLDRDYLVGMSSSKFIVRDVDARGLPVFPGLDWSMQSDLSFQFFQDGAIDNPQFHQVNVFAVAGHTLQMVESELGCDIVWASGGPLEIRPHAFVGANAFYDPGSPSLHFGYFTSPFRRTPVWTCLSHDVVAHELGHAVLDNYRPLFMYSGNIDTGALHEAMGDILAMFSALEHPQVVSHVFKETQGDMFHASLITGLGEEFGIGVSGVMVPYLRSALLGPAYDPTNPTEVHDRSTIWTAAVYEIVAELVKLQAPKDNTAFAAAVATAIRWVRGMLIRALSYTAPTGLSMPVFARLIYEADQRVYPTDSKFREIAKKVFEGRNLWNNQLDFTAPDIGGELQTAANQGPAALARFVMQQAPALRIPLDTGARLLTPRLVSTVRQVDSVSKNSSKMLTIAEHYFSFAFETVVAKKKDNEIQMFTVYTGGTLVLDEQWKAGLLVNDPEVLQSDAVGPVGMLQAVERAKTRFESLRRRLGCPAENASGWPFQVIASDAGPALLKRKRCNIREHVQSISSTGFVLPFARRQIHLSSDNSDR